ncbi:MAG: polyprenyl synthetase family protein [Nitrospirota bacterium]|nr:MAG: polyprenyl synthetase family protein [Nitrospirota bacterium]
MSSFKDYLNNNRDLVNSFLEDYLSEPFLPPKLHESVRYSLMAGGKRVRPILCMAAYEACGGDPKDILPQAAALELIHTYSLVHDDLPAMDDDDLRRGRPTNHIVFGEAMAILAGDALLTDAFRIFSESKTISAEKLIAGTCELAASAGIFGMVAGQAQDIISEKAEPDRETLEFIHLNKTAALIKCAVRIGALLSQAGPDTVDHLTEYGKKIGLAFQVVDDILDIVSSTEELGKPSGSDQEKSKMTYPSLYGIERSREIAAELVDNAKTAAGKIEGDPSILIDLADYLLERTN